jgi:hypothetical protein
MFPRRWERVPADGSLLGLVDGDLVGMAFSAVWLAVVLVESVVALVLRGAVVAFEVVCAALTWVGAEY